MDCLSSSFSDEEAGEGRAAAPEQPHTIIKPARGLVALSLADAVRAGEAAGVDAHATPPTSSSVPIPIPIPPRVVLEPGGYVGDVGATPPGVTRAASETLEAALTSRAARLGGGGGGGSGPRPPHQHQPTPPAGASSAPRPPPDGLTGGEAAWWAAAAAAVYPTAPPPPPADGRASEAALWAEARAGAAALAAAEPVLASTLHAAILAQPDLPRALAAILMARLGPDGGGEPGGAAAAPLPSEREAGDLFASPALRLALVADVCAAHYRSPDSLGVAQTLLYHPGLHALAAQRLSRALWWWGGSGGGGGSAGPAAAPPPASSPPAAAAPRGGRARRRGAALALQARASAVLGADLHPAAAFGPGVLLSHPLGTVAGEAAVVGDGAVLGHAVTLGGTGKESGDRHPKVGPGAQVGSHAVVLGNISVGPGARVAAGALVVRPVPAGALAAGSPARLVGLAEEMGWDL